MSKTDKQYDSTEFGADIRALKHRLKQQRILGPWKRHVFEVHRLGETVKGRKVPPRRVVVIAPIAAAAEHGIGLARDESYKRVSSRITDILQDRSIKRLEMADAFESLGASIKSGMSLPEALQQSARIARAPRLRGIFASLSYLATQGIALHEAMGLFPEQFSATIVSLIATAEHAVNSEIKGDIMLSIAAQIYEEGALLGQFITAVGYPLFIVLLACVATVVLCTFALPPMVELFVSFHVALPRLTQVYYAIGCFLKANAIFLGCGLIVGSVIMGAYTPKIVAMPWTQRMLLRLPVFGPIILGICLSRALSVYVLLRKYEAPVASQYRLAAATSGNVVVAEYFGNVYLRIMAGDEDADAFSAERDLLGEEGQRIAAKMSVVGSHGNLDELFGRAIGDLRSKSERRIKLMPKVLNFPLLLLCGALLGSMVAAIMLPYPGLARDVMHQTARDQQAQQR